MSSQILNQYFKLSKEQSILFSRAIELYTEWNQKINVVSRKDIDYLVERHFLHSLAIAKFTNFTPKTKILDIGTGGGFPGIPLAIMFPEVEFVLADSIAKKIKVVEEISNELGLTNVTAKVVRAEKLKNSFDFIVSRAVTAFPKFMNFCHGKIKKQQQNALANGIIYLKGGDFEEELQNYKSAEIYPISQYFNEDFFETKKIIYLPY